MTTLVSEMPLTVHPPRTGDQTAPNARSRITLPKVEQDDSLAAKILIAQKADREEANQTTDLLIQGLVERLPQANSEWSLDDRAKWLRTAVSIFDLVYKADDGALREIAVVLSKREIELTA
jgi:hypothetical protein